METTTYILQSGVEVECNFITGEHQKIFSTSSGTENEKKMLKALIKRMGKKETVTSDDIDKMPVADVKDLYIKLRMDNYEPDISFDLTWKDKQGDPFKHRHTINLSEKLFLVRPAEKKITSYEELSETYTVELPFSKKKVQVTRMTQKLLSEKAKGMNRNDIHLNSMLEFQELRYVTVDEDTKKTRLFKVDLDKMRVRDIEFLRGEIIRNEGQVTSMYSLKNPSDGMHDEQQVDLIGGIGFLFPSL